MEATIKNITPEDYILSVLSPEERLDAAFEVAKEAFKKNKLTIKDIEDAVERVRRKIHAESRQKGRC